MTCTIYYRMLAAEYGSLEMAPHTLTATILECEENSMTQVSTTYYL